MRSTQLSYLLREGLLGLVRRRVSGTVAVLIMASSLLMLALFSLVTIHVDGLLQAVRGDIDVVVYLDDEIHPADQALLHKDLLGMPAVSQVRYVAREQALERFAAELGDDAELLEALESNPLPTSFELRLSAESQDTDQVEALTRSVRDYPGVIEVVAHIEWVRRLDQVRRIFLVVDLAIGIIVLVSALFVISNTVRLTVEERADEVAIMRLVGATDAFIRMPFVLSGALQGALAGVLAMTVLVFAHRVVSLQVSGITFFAPAQLAGFVLLSTALGGVGSLFALRRHLRL